MIFAFKWDGVRPQVRGTFVQNAHRVFWIHSHRVEVGGRVAIETDQAERFSDIFIDA
jgi:hypothetical protein